MSAKINSKKKSRTEKKPKKMATRVEEKHNISNKEPEVNIANQNKENGYVSSLVNKGFESYSWSKNKAMENKMIAQRIKPSLEFVEEKLAEANRRAPYSVDQVVNMLDTRVDHAIKYGKETYQVVSKKPVDLKNSTLTVIHRNLEKLKPEEEIEETEQKENEEPSLREIYTDVKVITTSSANKILDISEGLVNKYLPRSPEETEEGEEELEVVKGKDKNTANRALHLSKVVTKRMQKRAMAQLNKLKMRTNQVVHVDLVKYSEMLDLDSKKVWFDEKKENVKAGLDKNVVVPLKNVGSSLNHSYGDLKEAAKKYQQAVRERAAHIKVPFSDQVIRVWTVVGDECDARIVKPCEQIIETFKQELKKQQELVQKQEDDPNKPLTIEAGLRAVIAAARFRLKKEWEMRVAPNLDSVLSKSPFSSPQKSKEQKDDSSPYKVGQEYDESDESTEPLFDAQD